MKKAILISVILLVMVITNPKKHEHIDAVKQVILKNRMDYNSLATGDGLEVAASALGLSLGMNVIDRLLENSVTVQNLVVLSLTKITYEDKSRVIGFGVFGNVWIFHEEGDLNSLTSTDEDETDESQPFMPNIEPGEKVLGLGRVYSPENEWSFLRPSIKIWNSPNHDHATGIIFHDSLLLILSEQDDHFLIAERYGRMRGYCPRGNVTSIQYYKKPIVKP